MKLIGVDIDLRRVHAVQESSQVVTLNEPGISELIQALIPLSKIDDLLLLVECASPHQYGGRMFKKKLSWMIYNSVILAALASAVSVLPRIRMLCSPSSTWTKGFPEQVRHKMASVDAMFPGHNKEDQHNLRECLAMIWFYRKTPDNWITVTEMLGDL